MQITNNFSLEEMYSSSTARRRGIDNTPSAAQKENLERLVVNVLQKVRDRFGSPITVNSGYRSPALNKAVGGVASSEHLTGNAADITSRDNRKLWNLMVEMVKAGELEVGQLIDEKRLAWIHVSNPSSRHKNEILRL